MCPNDLLLSRLRANRGAHARKFRVCVEKGWEWGGVGGGGWVGRGEPPPSPRSPSSPPFLHHALSSHNLDLSSRSLSSDATRPQQPTLLKCDSWFEIKNESAPQARVAQRSFWPFQNGVVQLKGSALLLKNWEPRS